MHLHVSMHVCMYVCMYVCACMYKCVSNGDLKIGINMCSCL